MFGLWFSKPTEREKQLADSIRSMKSVRVSPRGSISIDPSEIANDESFIKAREDVLKTLASS